MLTDKEVIEYCNINKHLAWDKRDLSYVNYLLNRFNDFSVEEKYDKCREAVFRLKHNLESVPLCENCGKPLKYLVGYKFYESACSHECKIILSNKRLRETSLKKYGTHRPSQSKSVKEKQKETNLKKYNGISPLCNDVIKEKTKTTLLKKYSVDNIAKSNQWKQHVNETSLLKYGTLFPNQNEDVKNKIKETCILHYGVDNYFKTDKIRNYQHSKERIEKIINTKRKNHTFNTSKIEVDSYNILKEIYKDVIYQYKSEKYPFSCDFYIPSLDLYIECNYHWTHGGHPYDETNEFDRKTLELWKEKNKKYYNNAITTWTIRDVNKRNIAKINNLHYIEIWSINELYNIEKKLNNYEENN